MNSISSTTQQPATNVDSAASPAGGFAAFVPVLLIGVLFYFLIMRPQQKRESAKKEKLSKLKKGDCIVTSSGAIGKINKVVSDTEVIVEVSEGVLVAFYKNFIAEVLDSPRDIPSSRDHVKKVAPVKRAKKEKSASVSEKVE